MTPTLATACAALPPEGACFPWGGPAEIHNPHACHCVCGAARADRNFVVTDVSQRLSQ